MKKVIRVIRKSIKTFMVALILCSVVGILLSVLNIFLGVKIEPVYYLIAIIMSSIGMSIPMYFVKGYNLFAVKKKDIYNPIMGTKRKKVTVTTKKHKKNTRSREKEYQRRKAS